MKLVISTILLAILIPTISFGLDFLPMPIVNYVKNSDLVVETTEKSSPEIVTLAYETGPVVVKKTHAKKVCSNSCGSSDRPVKDYDILCQHQAHYPASSKPLFVLSGKQESISDIKKYKPDSISKDEIKKMIPLGTDLEAKIVEEFTGVRTIYSFREDKGKFFLHTQIIDSAGKIDGGENEVDLNSAASFDGILILKMERRYFYFSEKSLIYISSYRSPEIYNPKKIRPKPSQSSGPFIASFSYKNNHIYVAQVAIGDGMSGLGLVFKKDGKWVIDLWELDYPSNCG